jgi:hypothetical protein
MTGLWPTRVGAHRSTKERRLRQPSISKGDGWEAVIPWDV